MYNRVVLIGRITAQPSLKYTAQGTAVTNFTLAVNRKFNKEETDFVNIVVWRQQAEFAANYGDKGRLALVEGRLQVRNYENQEGKKVYVTEVVADEVRFLDGKKKEGQQESKEANDSWDDLGREVKLEDLDIPDGDEIPF